MSILRSFGKAIGSLILVLSIGTLITLLSLVEFTTYDNLKPILAKAVEQQLAKGASNEQIILMHSQLIDGCKGKESVEVPLGENSNVTLKCSEVMISKPEELTGLLSSAMISKIYYKNYDCNYLDCYMMVANSISGTDKMENALFIFSQKSNQFLSQLSMQIWIAVAVGVVMVIVSARTWSGRFKSIGINLLSIAVLFFVFYFAKDFIMQQIASQRGVPIQVAEGSDISSITGGLFNSLLNKYVIVLIAGAGLTAFGFIIGYKEKKAQKS